jgi:hypothetical protein
LKAYVETSAALKLLIEELESVALSAYLDELVGNGVDLVSSWLLETELRRCAVRLELSQMHVTELLDRFTLFELDRLVFNQAGLLPGAHLRSLDALHIAGAMRVGAEVFVAYDVRQSESAQAVGLRVRAPV